MDVHADVTIDNESAMDTQSDVTIEELVAAIGDPAEAERLLRERGWTREDLIRKAEAITKDLSDSLGKMNVV